MSNQTELKPLTESQQVGISCVCHLKFKKCSGNCDHKYHQSNRESFKALALEVEADMCMTGKDYRLEIPGPLTSDSILRIVRWCGVRSFGFEIMFRVKVQRTILVVYAEAGQP